MSLTRAGRVIRDTGYLAAGQVVGGLVGLFCAAWFARHLPSQELSMWPVCVVVVSVVYPLSNLGTYNAFVREIPKLVTKGKHAQAARMLRTGLLGTMLCSVLVCLLVIPLSKSVGELLLKGELPAGLIKLIVIAVFTRAVAKHLDSFLNAFQEYRLLAVSRAVGRTFRPVAALVLYLIAGIQGSVWGLALGSAVGCTIAAYGLLRRLRGGTGLMSPVLLLKNSGPFYLTQLYKGLVNRADYILVGALGGADDLALYYVACRVIEYVEDIDTYIMETLTPKLAEKSMEGRKASEGAFTKCSRYFFLGMVPLHVGLAAVGPAVIRLYAGSEYADAGIIFSVLCIYLIARGFDGLYRRHIIVMGNRWHTLLVDVASKTVSVGLIAFFTYQFASLGAAAGRLFAVVLVLPLSVYLLRRVLRTRHSVSGLVLGGAGSFLALMTAAAVQLISDSSLVAIGVLPLAICLYLAFLRRKLQPADMKLVTQIMPSRLFGAQNSQRIQSSLERFYLDMPDKPSSAQGEV